MIVKIADLFRDVSQFNESCQRKKEKAVREGIQGRGVERETNEQWVDINKWLDVQTLD